ncbi:unnamed protein product [Chrysoparadoxa australica]
MLTFLLPRASSLLLLLTCTLRSSAFAPPCPSLTHWRIFPCPAPKRCCPATPLHSSNAGFRQPDDRGPEIDWEAYIELMRPQNILPSAGLVAIGAWVSSHDVTQLLSVKVLLTALAAVLVATGSCILNDWFDVAVDAENKPNRPLVTGRVKLGHALALSCVLLLGALASAWVVNPLALQMVIASSVCLVTMYTPVLKPFPLLKNFVAAGVIAVAITAGGLAAGAEFSSSFIPAAVVFFCTVHREIVMDVGDVEGDRTSGVITLPVLLGRGPAIAVAAGLLAFGLSFAARDVASSIPALALLGSAGAPMFVNLYRIKRSDYDEEDVERAVDFAFVPLILILGLIGLAGGGASI